MIDADGLLGVVDELVALRECLLAAERSRSEVIAATDVSFRRSATNLVHYVELRCHDIRGLQDRLGLLGLSSLGRAKPAVLATLEAVLTALAGLRAEQPPKLTAQVGLAEGHELLARHTEQLLGREPDRRSTRIMVTLPSEAADDETLIVTLGARGMDLARINCAHDDATVWARMITRVRRDAGTSEQPCRIAMDLGGPKLRTGPLLPGPRVIRIKPRRDNLGRPVAPARVRLSASVDAGSVDALSAVDLSVDADAGGDPIVALPVVDEAWVSRRRRGDVIRFTDARGSNRRWTVTDVGAGSVVAEAHDTAYVTAGLKLECQHGHSGHSDDDEDSDHGDDVEGGVLPEIEQLHRVRRGDRVILTRSLEPAVPTRSGLEHSIGCTLTEAFDCARPGERVWLDDGKIGGIVESVDGDEIAVAVTDVRPGGAKLAAGKGINLPDTDLRLDALTAKDLDDLVFVAPPR